MRHLRRARRRSGFDRVLPKGRVGLRFLQPIPRADRTSRGRSGSAEGRRHRIGPQGRVSRNMRGQLDMRRIVRVIALVAVVAFVRFAINSMRSSDSISYQGQTIKLKKSYASYE